jgi:hypothetical protein
MSCGSARVWAQDSVTIPLDPNPEGNGFDNFITVSVGGGPASEVLLDTGSTGLRFRKEDIGSHVTITDIPITYGYSSGNELKGFLGFAPVAFPDASAPTATPGPIAIQVVTKVDCKKDKPDCPGWQTIQKGVMGVAYDNDQIFNPFAQLAGNLGSGFIVVDNDITNPNVDPHVVVGLTPSNMQGFVFAPLGKTRAAISPPACMSGTPRASIPASPSTAARKAASIRSSTQGRGRAASSRRHRRISGRSPPATP